MELVLGKVSSSLFTENRNSISSLVDKSGIVPSITNFAAIKQISSQYFQSSANELNTTTNTSSKASQASGLVKKSKVLSSHFSNDLLRHSEKINKKLSQFTQNSKLRDNISQAFSKPSQITYTDAPKANASTHSLESLPQFNFNSISSSPKSAAEGLTDSLIVLPMACAAFIPSMAQKFITSRNNKTLPQGRTGQRKSSFDLVKNFAAGAVAGVVSRSSTAPLERLKILYQVNYEGVRTTPNMFTGLKQIYVQDGVSGLFRGNLLTVLKASPFSAIRFTVFEQMKKVLSLRKQPGEGLGQADMFVAGAVAGFVSNFAIYPMEVIRVRITAAPKGTYDGIYDAFLKIQKSEGRVLPFYRGATTALCTTMPNTGINLMTYEYLKKLILGEDRRKAPNPAVMMAIGSTSALISSTLLYPFSAIGSKLIMLGAKVDLKPHERSLKSMVTNIFKKEGLRGFYKGYLPGISKIVLGNGISFATYESVKNNMA